MIIDNMQPFGIGILYNKCVMYGLFAFPCCVRFKKDYRVQKLLKRFVKGGNGVRRHFAIQFIGGFQIDLYSVAYSRFNNASGWRISRQFILC